MSHYIGIDGGGTSTKAALANSKGEIIAESQAPPSNPHNVGYTKAAAAIYNSCQDLLDQTNLSSSSITTIAAGIAGLRTTKETDQLRSQLNSYPLFHSANLYLTHDLEIAYYSELRKTPGLCIIVGTGSSCYARSPDAKEIRVSGRSNSFDDPASGYAIASKAIAKGLIAETRKSDSSKANIASRASEVLAMLEDPIAQSIATDEVKQLGALAAEAALRADFNSSFPVRLVGGMTRHPAYSEILVAIIQEALPKGEIRIGNNRPLSGAIGLAINLIKG
ncbi:MAG: BadF/BadG/BcrA/BcrD ATPase family protein [Verrucomicrobiota bacterium]